MLDLDGNITEFRLFDAVPELLDLCSVILFHSFFLLVFRFG